MLFRGEVLGLRQLPYLNYYSVGTRKGREGRLAPHQHSEPLPTAKSPYCLQLLLLASQALPAKLCKLPHMPISH